MRPKLSLKFEGMVWLVLTGGKASAGVGIGGGTSGFDVAAGFKGLTSPGFKGRMDAGTDSKDGLCDCRSGLHGPARRDCTGY